MVRVGLTGGIASGKSLVAAELAARGAIVIDADVLAREVVEPGTPALAAIVERFGSQVLTDGQLDRSRLGEIVFADPLARRDLERIVHPAVRARAIELERAARGLRRRGSCHPTTGRDRSTAEFRLCGHRRC